MKIEEINIYYKKTYNEMCEFFDNMSAAREDNAAFLTPLGVFYNTTDYSNDELFAEYNRRFPSVMKEKPTTEHNLLITL